MSPLSWYHHRAHTEQCQAQGPGRASWHITVWQLPGHLFYYKANFTQFALQWREIPLTSIEIVSGPKCILQAGANMMAKHEPRAASSLLQQRTAIIQLLRLKGKVSTKDRGFATLTHHKNIFNVTTTIPEGDWFSPGKSPHLSHWDMEGLLTAQAMKSVPMWPLLQVPFLGEKRPFEPQDLE